MNNTEYQPIYPDQFRELCQRLKLEVTEREDPYITGMLGMDAYVYSPIFKYGKDSIASLYIQDESCANDPEVSYCDNVVNDDNYGNYIVLDEGRTGCWRCPHSLDELELHLRRAIDKIREVEENTKWPKRQHFQIDVFYDQHRDMRYTREDLDEIVWKLYDMLDEKMCIAILNADGRTYYPKDNFSPRRD